jgi:hypothetical protein
MPIREFVCKKDGVFESYVSGTVVESRPCPKCGAKSKLVEFSVPAKRDSRHGIVN